MKLHFIITTALILNIGVIYSQDTLKIYGNTPSYGTIQYYFNADKDHINSMQCRGTYELEICHDTIKQITLSYKDGYCDQILKVDKLMQYAKKNNTNEIKNDLTSLKWFACIRMDGEQIDSVEHFCGKWVNNETLLSIYSNETFDLKYSNEDGSFQREGKYKIKDRKTITLKTVYIRNLDLNTYQDNKDEFVFHFAENKLVSDDGEKTYERLKDQ